MKYIFGYSNFANKIYGDLFHTMPAINNDGVREEGSNGGWENILVFVCRFVRKVRKPRKRSANSCNSKSERSLEDWAEN